MFPQNTAVNMFSATYNISCRTYWTHMKDTCCATYHFTPYLGARRCI